MNEPSDEWTTEPIKREDGSRWLGLAYIAAGERRFGALNEQQAIAICKAHNAAIAKLREELAELKKEHDDNVTVLKDYADTV